jgi:hypothetical protein
VWNIEEASSNFTEINDQNYTDDDPLDADRFVATSNLNLYIFLVILCKTLLCLLGKKSIYNFFQVKKKKILHAEIKILN